MINTKNNVCGRDKYLGNEYNNTARFISYSFGYQLISSLIDSGKILEVGGGNKVLSNMFKQDGFDVVTADLDPSNSPDIVSDVRDLSKHFSSNSFDVIYLFQVLEHIPIDDLSETLKSLSALTNKYVVVSLPKISPYFQLIFHAPFMQRFFKKEYLDLSFHLKMNKNYTLDPGHYWEIGSVGVDEAIVRKHMNSHFKSVRELSPQLNKLHSFFILEK